MISHPLNQSPKNAPKWKRLTAAGLLVVSLFTATATFWPHPAEAQWAITTITDLPRQIGDFIDKAATKVKEAIKVATDIAFKNSLEILNARIAQEVMTSISSAGPGQKPLFLTDPKTFFTRIKDTAAGTFIDEFTKGLTGSQGVGTAYSTSRQRFLISRVLRTAIGSPLAQCRDTCRDSFAVEAVYGPDFIGPKEEQNEHEQRVSRMMVNIDKTGGTKEIAGTTTPTMICVDAAQPEGPLAPGQTYRPWQIVIGACQTAPYDFYCETTPQECLRRQQEAINTERSTAQEETRMCLQDCNQGGAMAQEQILNDLTATDIFSSIGQLDARTASAKVADAFNKDKSDVGQLLGALSALSVRVQDKVTGEQTYLQSGTVPRTSKVSEVVLVPTEANQQSMLTALTGGDDAKKIYTGTSAADVIKGVAAFINSPIGKMFASFFQSKCGLNPAACTGPTTASSTIGQLLFGSGSASGMAGAQLLYKNYGKIQYMTGDPGRNEVNIPDQLSSSGLIDAQFRSAIEDELTVQEALDKGLLDGQKTLGFDKNGIQATQGYSYRALQYLRKFRVIPVGWELAALYSQRWDPRDLSLNFLTREFAVCGQDAEHTATPEDKYCADDNTTPCTDDAACAPATCDVKLTASPYCGLVDPNWVLKAPQSYCRRQGAGEEILTKEFVCDENNVDESNGDLITDPNLEEYADQVPNCVSGSYPDMGRWIVSRNSDTCADLQSCIAENDDGTCIAFGYCVQERQTYKFDGTRCDPQYNSCNTYTDTETNLSESYLAKTLDFRNCNADVAGCQWYCQLYDETNSAWNCAEPELENDYPNEPGAVIRFAGGVKSCTQSDHGCRQYYRTTNGSNLLRNSGLELFVGATIDDGQPLSELTGWDRCLGDGDTDCANLYAVTASDPVYTANNLAAISLEGTLTGGISQTVDTGSPLYERGFIGSIRAQANTACTARLRIQAADSAAAEVIKDIYVGTACDTHQVTLIVPPEGQVILGSNEVKFSVLLGACSAQNLTVDNLQLEENIQTQYKDYGAVNLLYLKGSRLACTPEDVGCEKYTPLAGGAAITAKALSSNRCDEANVGCGTYALEPIISPLPRPGGTVNIIPAKGQQCSAADVGCEEYTNLDEVARGGEGLAYFKSVKQCVNPDPTASNQVTYYTWVGDATRGFILRSYTLLQSNLNNGPCTNVAPVTSADGVPTCRDAADTIAVCSAADLADNPDCAEYYDSQLNVYYRLRSRTVSVTAECHPYRNTVDQTDADATNDSNIYFLSTPENVTCAAAAAGCRAYTGNNGRTTRQVFTDSFDSGTTVNWVGGSVTSESVTIGGYPMLVASGDSGTGAAFTQAVTLSDKLLNGRQYLVSFIAAAADQASAGATIGAAFGTTSGETSFNATKPFGSGSVSWSEDITPAGPYWRPYTFGPVTLTSADLRLGITVTGGNAYVDNIVLTEITDSFYLVADTVPSCPASEVGCAAYRDRSGTTNYLKSFNRICAEKVVGCEALIDTQNSSTPFGQTVKNETVPEDQVVNIVNDRGVYCAVGKKGCEAFGLPVYTADQVLTSYRTVYRINDPDRYITDLCVQNELGCKSYTNSSGGVAFFKDPGTGVCEYKEDNSDIGGSWKIKDTDYSCPSVTPPLQGRPIGYSCSPVCVGGTRANKACTSDGDCPGGSCVGDYDNIGKISTIIDSETVYVYGQCTINTATGTDDCGGENRCVYLAGLCPDEQNGCNEYRDPTDPSGCRSECPLEQQGGSPIYMDAQCQPTVCAGNATTAGQNCQTSQQCGDGGRCVDANGEDATGIPGCRSYFYLRQTVEENAADCNGQINTDIGCRAFNDTSKSTLNFRGE